MRFQVPQFIDSEDVLFAGLTLRQFLIVAVGVILIFLSFTILGITFQFIIVAALLGGGAFFIAKGSVEGMPTYLYLFSAFQFLLQNKKFEYHSNRENLIDQYGQS